MGRRSKKLVNAGVIAVIAVFLVSACGGADPTSAPEPRVITATPGPTATPQIIVQTAPPAATAAPQIIVQTAPPARHRGAADHRADGPSRRHRGAADHRADAHAAPGTDPPANAGTVGALRHPHLGERGAAAEHAAGRRWLRDQEPSL